MKFTDSHCHLDFPELNTDLTKLIADCINADIHRIIIPSISPDNWQRVLTFVEQNGTRELNLHPALGIHPWFLKELTNKHLEALNTLIEKTNTSTPELICAIGETGIDGKIAEEQNNLEQQLSFFEYQLELAKLYQLPVIVHHRKSHQHIVPLLKQAKVDRGGIIHAFSGSYQQAKQYLDLGFKLGIGGTITYPRAEKTIKAIKKLPIDSMVLETDAPAMPLNGRQGQPNSPKYLVEVFEQLARVRTENKEQLAEQLENNINNVFNF